MTGLVSFQGWSPLDFVVVWAFSEEPERDLADHLLMAERRWGIEEVSRDSWRDQRSGSGVDAVGGDGRGCEILRLFEDVSELAFACEMCSRRDSIVDQRLRAACSALSMTSSAISSSLDTPSKASTAVNPFCNLILASRSRSNARYWCFTALPFLCICSSGCRKRRSHVNFIQCQPP